MKIFIALFIMSLLSIVVSTLFITDPLYKLQLYFSPIRWFYVFALGGIIYQYCNNLKCKVFFVTYKNQLLSFLIVLWTLFSYLNLPAGYLVFSFLLGFFFILNKFNEIRAFNNNFFENIGKISFSIYLIHMPVFNYIILIYTNIFSENLLTIDYPLLSYLILFAISTIIVVLISIVTYHIIEKPFIKIGKLYIQKDESFKV